jgi:hypothetical protein
MVSLEFRGCLYNLCRIKGMPELTRKLKGAVIDKS